MSITLHQPTLKALEWDRLLDLVARQTHSSMGADRCRALPLASDLAMARRFMQETAEWLGCLDRGEVLPGLAFPDVRGPLNRAEKGAVLEAHDLRDVGTAMGVMRETAAFLASRTESLPAVAAVGEPLRDVSAVRTLKDRIDRCIDPEGGIRDTATAELRRLTGHAHDLKQTMRRRLDTILSSGRYADVLQERYFAQRQGRYVVPVKAEFQSRIPGIVHDVSSSGATVFLEPRELVELNNEIKVAELEIEREVRRILADLSAETGKYRAVLETGLDVLADLDAIAAKAAFSRQIDGHPTSLSATGRIALRRARHPLLVLARQDVVANDIVLDPDVRVLMISGPNTGGKTVTLKLLGLSALMVRVGLLPACDPDSEMPFFSHVFADIGDAQDLTRDLSSFSAHMVQLIELLGDIHRSHSEVDAPGGPATWLVLLDELATSTDPAEGAALAEALLVHLAGLGVTIVTTTHYQSLKALAQSTPGFRNASVEFDIATLSPTYRLCMGIPGGSSALDIAGRLGLSEDILEQAVEALTRDATTRRAHTVEQLLTEVQARQRRLDEERDELEALRAQAERDAREAAERLAALRGAEREERKAFKRKLTDDLLRARAEIQSIVTAAKQERSAVAAREAKRRLSEVEAAATPAPTEPVIPPERLQAGDAVEITGLGVPAVLLESPHGKKRVKVRAGETEVSVSTDRLIGTGGASPTIPAAARRLSGQPADVEASVVVDLRGKAADEALEATVAALDRAALAGHPSLRVIHGHGTGRLKSAIRDYLKESPYVASFRPGDRPEGGDGVTVVQLRA